VLVTANVVKTVTEGATAFLVEYPSVFLVDLVGVHFCEIADARVLGELGARQSTQSKEFRAKPDLLHVGLVIVFGDDLFYGEELRTAFMLTKPHKTKPSPPQQLNLLTAIRKPIAKDIKLLIR
jgi:hypothetical protein